MRAVLYAMRLSNSSLASIGALRQKRVPFAVRNLRPGFHAPLVRAAGFPDRTVPALRLDGTRVQGSLRISRALDVHVPERPLFPADPAARHAVEEAEAWGEGELQDVPRRIFRWSVHRDMELRTWLMSEIAKLPAPGLLARTGGPVTAFFVRDSGASDARVEADVRGLDRLLDRVDALMDTGTIGGEEVNAADCQVLASVRVLLGFEDLRERVAARACAAPALAMFPDYPRIPRTLPAEWLGAATANPADAARGVARGGDERSADTARGVARGGDERSVG